MRSKEEFENERNFGLQKFDTPKEAFDVMSGEWGENSEAISQGQLFILCDDDFKKLMFERSLMCCIKYKLGLINKEEYEYSLWLDEWSNDYLMDCDFFLYSEVGKCFYTCRMSFKDDQVYMWNQRQWAYYRELFELYDIASITDKAQYVVDRYFEENKNTEYILCIGHSGAVKEDVFNIYEDITSAVYDEEKNKTFVEVHLGADWRFCP